jgi:DNA-binding XRE family transcriptional regulator
LRRQIGGAFLFGRKPMSQPSIYEMRTRAGLRQGLVARKAGIVQSTLCSIEKGHRVPTPQQLSAIKSAIEELTGNRQFGFVPTELTDAERLVWNEVAAICPKLPKMPPRAQCIKLVRLIAKMRTEGIGRRDGKNGLTVPELEMLVFLFDRFKMTPASRGAIPWPEPQSATDARNQLAAHGVK